MHAIKVPLKPLAPHLPPMQLLHTHNTPVVRGSKDSTVTLLKSSITIILYYVLTVLVYIDRHDMAYSLTPSYKSLIHPRESFKLLQDGEG